uniref:Meckel syndrome type 1 protein n=1 Tax=Glossina brevipalpis TaxID=37001 RepID=A0A1A9WAT4_9MUSC
MFNKLPKCSGFYQIKDNIDLLQLQIQLRYMNSLLKLPRYEIKETEEKLEEFGQNWIFRNNGFEKSFQNDIIEVTIKWQQKLLSAKEVELYSNIENCTTDTQREYHQWLMMEDKNNQIKKTRRHINRLKKNKMSERSKSQIGTNLISLGDNTIFTYVDKDNFWKEKDISQQKEGIWQEKPSKIMYIYAALNPDTMLAVLKWYEAQRLLHIYPNFNDYNSNAYYIEINTDYRHLYSYGITTVSPQISNRKSIMNNLTYIPETFHSQCYTKSEIDQKKFSLPPQTTQRYSVLFEIQDILDTEYNDIHVRYHIKMPPNYVLEDGILDGTTHSVSTSSSSSLNDSINIGFCWQITIFCKHQYNHNHRLHIFFEVISIDSWDRERVEGYTYYAISLLQANHECVTLKCMRPKESLFDAFSRYFIGGYRQFDFIRFFANIPREHEKEHENRDFHLRYNAKMQNTCQLNFKWQDITQRNCELLQKSERRKPGMTLNDIMTAYRKARKRLETVTIEKSNKNKVK